MRIFLSALLGLSALLAPIAALAQSADVEATITGVSPAEASITLDDGNTYKTPSEFNFEGLEEGVRVVIFYTAIDDKRVINDLEVIQ